MLENNENLDTGAAVEENNQAPDTAKDNGVDIGTTSAQKETATNKQTVKGKPSKSDERLAAERKKKEAEKKEAEKKRLEAERKKKEAEEKAAEKKRLEAERKKKEAEKKAAEKKRLEAERKKKEAEKRAAEEKKKANAKNKSKQADKSPSETSGKKKSSGFKYLTGLLFAKMMRGGANELRANAEKVNKLNVFPVPDGDTGDNMSMTIESGVAALETLESDDLALVMKVASKGMLLGARGNSGVILSQFFAGIAKNLENADAADPVAMGKALEAGVEQAYASVMTPTEGTILTVARESVAYAISRITPKSTIRTLFADLVKEMNAAVERTPETLAVLKEAGVVDSGGAGLFYIIDGLNRVLNGEEIAPTAEKPSVMSISTQSGEFGPDSTMDYGYCTELLIQLMNAKCDVDSFDIEPLKEFLASIGNSVVAFKTDSVVKVHVHTMTPERVLEYARGFGEFISVKIENMSLQHTEAKAEDKFEKAPEPIKKEAPVEKKKYAVVTVANGAGIKAIFTELMADVIVEGGQTNNPSAKDFIDAFEQVSAEHIFVLPNNSNIIMAASQAAEIYTGATVHVLNTKTVGAGYVALSTLNLDAPTPEEIISDVEASIHSITSAYVSPSIRDADMNGVHVSAGDTIGVINKEIVVSMPDRTEATKSLIVKMFENKDKYMLTVFKGSDASVNEACELEAFVAENFPEVECYFLDGGQDIYPYIFVAE
ncbi:MAG: DAK2 domain-containing protein [Clostridia bacterium]|nr:DAK2 domain-containing protein [Clostridia bacterium]